MALKANVFTTLAGIALIGCGNLADEKSDPPALATITGTLSLAEGVEVPEGQLRMALLWATEDQGNLDPDELESFAECGLSKRFLELARQEISLDPSFPNQFTLAITEPPPAEAMLPRDEGGPRITAEARIVVYVDGNENGQLDVRAPDQSSPDLVLSTSEPELWRTYSGTDVLEYIVLYFSEPYHFESSGISLDYPAGFTLHRYHLEENVELLPIETPIELRLTAAPYLQDVLCEATCQEFADEAECPASLVDLPAPPDDAIAYSSHAGTPAWGWAEGSSKHVTLHARCGQPDNFNWRRTSCDDCRCIVESCIYERANVPVEEWPCDEGDAGSDAGD